MYLEKSIDCCLAEPKCLGRGRGCRVAAGRQNWALGGQNLPEEIQEGGSSELGHCLEAGLEEKGGLMAVSVGLRGGEWPFAERGAQKEGPVGGGG